MNTEPLAMMLTAAPASTRNLTFPMFESVLDTGVMVEMVGASSIGLVRHAQAFTARGALRTMTALNGAPSPVNARTCRT